MQRRPVIYIGIGVTLALIVFTGLLDSRPIPSGEMVNGAEQTAAAPPAQPDADRLH